MIVHTFQACQALLYNTLTYYYYGVYVYLNTNVVQEINIVFTGSKYITAAIYS